MVEKEEQQHPLVNVEGVVVQVQKKERIAIAHAIHYGRIFISARFYNENIIEFGKWISMQIDSDPFNKVAEANNCQFKCANYPKQIDDVLEGHVSRKNGNLRLLMETHVFVGAETFKGFVGLSSKLGRVLFTRKFCEKFKLVSLTWKKCGVSSIEPSPENLYCSWEVISCMNEDDDDPKLELSIRKCNGKLFTFRGRNICILQLFNQQGFVTVYATDFSHPIRSEKLIKEAQNIEVYTSTLPEGLPHFPIHVCYARILDEAYISDVVKDIHKSIMNNPGDIVRKKEKLVDLAETTASTSTYNNNEICKPFCETLPLIEEILSQPSTAKFIQKIDPKLYSDLCLFTAKYG